MAPGRVPVHTCWHEANRGYLRGVPSLRGPVSPSNRIARPVPTASGARPFGDTLTGFPLDRPTQAEPSLWRCASSHKCWHEVDTPGGSLALASRGLQKAPWAAGVLPTGNTDRWPGSCAGSHNMLARSQSGIPSRGSLAPGARLSPHSQAPSTLQSLG